VRDIGLADELALDAFVSALTQWPEEGIPRNPGAWLMAIAKRRVVDRLQLICGVLLLVNRYVPLAIAILAALRSKAISGYTLSMCRNIRTLFNFDPPATDDDVRAASLQFVRKLSGFTKPSQVNEAAFERAVDRVTAAARELMGSLVTTAAPHDREMWIAKAKARSAERFAKDARSAN
jgi:hypothetical protein